MIERIKGPIALAEVLVWSLRDKIAQIAGKVGVAQEVDFDYPRYEVTKVERPVATEEELNEN